MNLTLLEALPLLFARHREPELDEVDPGVNEETLKLRHFLHEFLILLVRAEPHYALNTRAVVPRAVEEHDFARGREVLHVALEVPLAGFGGGRLIESDEPRAAGVHVFHEARDRAAFACRVAAFKENHDPASGLLHPGLQLQELHLELELFGFIDLAAKVVLIGVAALFPVFGKLNIRVQAPGAHHAALLVLHFSGEEPLQDLLAVRGGLVFEDHLADEVRRAADSGARAVRGLKLHRAFRRRVADVTLHAELILHRAVLRALRDTEFFRGFVLKPLTLFLHCPGGAYGLRGLARGDLVHAVRDRLGFVFLICHSVTLQKLQPVMYYFSPVHIFRT